MTINENQKYPNNKKQYDRNYLKIFGVPCPRCNPKGQESGKRDCLNCGGDGWIQKGK